MGSEKIPFTSSQEQSGNLGCDASHHLYTRSVSFLLLDSFMGLIHWQTGAI